MDIHQQFEEICQSFPAFRSAISHVQEKTQDQAAREYLGKMLSELDSTFEDVKQKVPKAIASIESSLAESQRDCETLQAKHADLLKQIAAQEAALAAAAEAGPPQPPELQIDPHWPHELVSELLAKYGLVMREKPMEYGDLWDYYDHDDQT